MDLRDIEDIRYTVDKTVADELHIRLYNNLTDEFLGDLQFTRKLARPLMRHLLEIIEYIHPDELVHHSPFGSFDSVEDEGRVRLLPPAE